MKNLSIRGSYLTLPNFLPDATFGFVRGLDANDLKQVGINAVMMNAFHLMQKPSTSIIQKLGGLHNMTGWDGLIMTDSGGFQAYSLIKQNSRFGSLGENGIIFRPEGSNRKLIITPEKSIQLQLKYGSDILICLDDCTHVKSTYEEQKSSVERTVQWAKRCKTTYQSQMDIQKIPPEARSLLFGVIQGGGYPELRRLCAEELLEIGFDGFGFGGWPLDEDSNLLTDILAYCREIVPEKFPFHALGIGHPVSVVACYRMGYGLFDCSMPTRDARHGRLYTLTSDISNKYQGSDWFKFSYINSEENIRKDEPISHGCDCPTCKNLSLGFLYHLYKMQDSSYLRLASMHNLRFMSQLMEYLRDDTETR